MPLCIDINMYKEYYPKKRFSKTISFLNSVVSPPAKILDLGVVNPLSELMQKQGYLVTNTKGEDLDLDFKAVTSLDYDVVTAFEIFEHLVSPFPLLKAIKANKLVATVPLNLWFSPAYKNPNDERDCHYHEFEDWQFDWLLDKAGWEVKKREKWTNPVSKIGIRPLLRHFTPRYYAVYAERK